MCKSLSDGARTIEIDQGHFVIAKVLSDVNYLLGTGAAYATRHEFLLKP